MSEYWDVYTKDRIKTGRRHERGISLVEGDYHIVVLVGIIDDSCRILITKRHQEKTWPNLWECTGGSILMNEESLDGAVREVKEETGINLNRNDGELVFSYIGEDTIYDVWAFYKNINLNEIILQENEVIDIDFVNTDKLKNLFKNSGLYCQ